MTDQGLWARYKAYDRRQNRELGLAEKTKRVERRGHVLVASLALVASAGWVLSEWWTNETIGGRNTAPDVTVARPVPLFALAAGVVVLVLVFTPGFFARKGPVAAVLLGAAGTLLAVLAVIAAGDDLVTAFEVTSAAVFGAATAFAGAAVIAVERSRQRKRSQP